MKIPHEVHRTTYGIMIGRIIATHRVNCAMEQGEFAMRIGMSQSGWSRIENGESKLSMEVLARASEILGLRPQDIVDQAERARTGLNNMGIEVLMTRPSKNNKFAIALLTGAALAFLLTKIIKP